MKKIFWLFMLTPLVWSCSSDDDNSSDKSELVDTKWSPEKVVPVLPFIGESEDYAQYYPHQSGCDKDYLLFLDQGEMKTYVHEPDCEVTEQVQSWEESGSTITVEYMGYNITGEVSGSTSNQMIIESDISEYAELINIYYPGIPIPEGAKMKLYLNKLNN